MKYMPLIIGMALVTYIPRLIPLIILKTGKIKKNLKLFLSFIPYTSLSILLMRGLIFSEADMKIPTIAGIIAASIIAYIQSSLILSVVGGIITAFIAINLFSF